MDFGGHAGLPTHDSCLICLLAKPMSVPKRVSDESIDVFGGIPQAICSAI